MATMVVTGNLHNIFVVPLVRESWRQIAKVVPADSSVFDAGCGTGGLAQLLRIEKNCRVIGVDLSRPMLDFATRANQYDEVQFLHMDISNVSSYPEKKYDYSVMCHVIHEIPAGKQAKVIADLMRIGKRTILLDSSSPLPGNITGIAARILDATDDFQSYVASGGIMGILERSGLISNVVHRTVFRHGCFQIVTLSRE
ncbi:MAG: class I SAM-dependent methyltransferase [Dehalococcoidia bacterium]|nr:class I SAM-dependent methyltransferase [Dehalococcoidia bacterium]